MFLDGTLLAILLLAPPQPQSGPVRLTLTAAVEAALESNASVQLAEESENQSAARAREQKSALLPDISASASYINQTVSLGAQGIQFKGIPIPNRTGPFGVTDLRLHASEPLLDLSLIRQYQAAKRSSSASAQDTIAVRQKIAAMVARLYYDVQRLASLATSAAAQITLDQRLVLLAQDRKAAGTGVGLDVTRASGRLAADHQQLIEYENNHRIATYRLLQAMGQRFDVTLELTDALSANRFELEALDAAIATAFRTRAEIRSSEAKLAAARMNQQAAGAERLPALRSFADYGNVGTAGSSIPTNSVGVQLGVPLFDGSRRAAHRQIAASQFRQEEIRDRDLHDQIELEVRIASSDITSAHQQVEAANEGLKLAEEELEQARVRFESQVGTQIDVITAQTNLSAARGRQVNALFAAKAAEIEFKRATGAAAY